MQSESPAHAEKGFTLIEMLVVAAIIGILVLIAVGTQVASGHLAGKVACQSDLRVTRNAVDYFHEEAGDYPGSLDQLVPARLSHKAIRCPSDDTVYDYNPSTGRVQCLNHGQ